MKIPASLLKHDSAVHVTEDKAAYDGRNRYFRIDESIGAIGPNKAKSVLPMQLCRECAVNSLLDPIASLIIEEAEVHATVFINNRKYVDVKSIKQLAMEDF